MPFSQEDLEAILGSSDLGSEEEAMKRQYAMAANLRNMGTGQAGNQRMDAGSQIARGIAGLGGGYAQMQGDAASKALSAQRLDLLRKLQQGSTPGGVGPNPQAAAQAATQRQAISDLDI
jgi:hypothetical protein